MLNRNDKELALRSRQVVFFLILLSLISCRNYNSDKYISIENRAINDIIPEMVKLGEMIELNDLHANGLKLFLISSLDTSISMIYKPEGYTVAVDGVDLSEEEVQENKERYEEEWENYKREVELFSSIKDGTMTERILAYGFTNSNLKIELVTKNKAKSHKLQQNEFGYLSISRVYFNRSFNKGYVSYGFFCGEGCAWGDNIEIRKIEGKWKITEYFSGGIA